MWNRTVSAVFGQVRRLSTGLAHLQSNVNQITVDPLCRINIKTSCPVNIRPCDLLDCPAANIVKATLSKNQTELDITLDNQGDQQIVQIHEKLTKYFGQDEILLEVPVKADLVVENSETVSLKDFQSDLIVVQSLKGIRTKNIKSETIELQSGGPIQCDGTTLAQHLVVETELDGDIRLDKVLGDNVTVLTEEGGISVNSCYSQSSSFTTKTGDLNLQNVHRNCEINVEERSNLTMSGFNGNLLVTLNSGSIDLQLAELHGESVILANNSADIDLKLGEEVTSNTYVHIAVHPDKLHLDEVLEPILGTKENGASTLNLSGLPNKLFVQTDGKVRIKQLSWAEFMFGGKTPE